MLRAVFIGHVAVGFASQRAAPRAPFTLLLTAPLFLDLLWPIFLLLGLESVRIDPGNTAFTPLDLHDYPYSHSLVGALVWSILFGGAYFLWRRESRGAWVLGAGVFSHWVLGRRLGRIDGLALRALGVLDSANPDLPEPGVFFGKLHPK